VLAVGDAVTVTYTVTVDRSDRGNGRLHNVVTTPTQPNGIDAANCSTGSPDSSCRTQTDVSSAPPTTAGTGNATQLQLILAGLLLAAGGLLLAVGRRRRRAAN
jgi:LPXTG-motif cell wall-anchored protein